MHNDSYRPHIVISSKEVSAPVKREYSGGGGGTYPRTSYREHATKVCQEIDQLKAIFSNYQDGGSSKVYYKVSLPEGHKVSSSEGKQLEENIRSDIVGSPAENIAHVSASKEAFKDLSLELAKYKDTEQSTGKSKFAMIEELSNIPFEEKISERFLLNFVNDNDEGEALIKTFPDLSEKDIETIVTGIRSFLENHHGSVLSVLPGDEGALLKVKSNRKVLKELVDTFISIQSLDSADELIEVMAAPGESIPDSTVVESNDSKAFACIFDTGVNEKIKYLKGSVIEHEYPFGENKGAGTSHGTFVASRVVYGDSIKDQISSGVLKPDIRLLSVCINKYDDIGNRKRVTVDELISVIRKTVEKWHNQIRVYNISLSCLPQNKSACPAIKDDQMHNLASEIDSLSRKYNVLFVVCTGNIPYSSSQPTPSEAYPKYFDNENSRIMPPGESMLALTVGSIANDDTESSMAKKNEPSPFTRRGPGFSGHCKPDLVANGGNYGINWSGHTFLDVLGLAHDSDNTAYSRGTSFSTPIITRLAAKIFELLPKASACLVKAMLIHFCRKDYSENFEQEMLDKLLGHGVPVPDRITNSLKNMQTYLYQGEMDYRDMIEIPFYVPSSLVNRKKKDKVKVRVTISFYPETSAVLRKGYCKSHIRTKIIKLNNKGVETDVGFAGSSMLDSDRYSTIIRMEKKFCSAISAGEWKIFIAHESRWTLKNPKTKFAVVITIEDPQNDADIDIYSSIRSEVKNKYQSELKIPERIKI
jgi:hypothetical protein